MGTPGDDVLMHEFHLLTVEFTEHPFEKLQVVSMSVALLKEHIVPGDFNRADGIPQGELLRVR